MYEIEQDGTEKRTKGGLNSLGSAFLSFSKISHFNQALIFHPLERAVMFLRFANL